MTTHPLGRLCGSVFAALLAATAVAGCSETQPPSTPTGVGGDDGTQPTSPLCSGDRDERRDARHRRPRFVTAPGFSFSPLPAELRRNRRRARRAARDQRRHAARARRRPDRRGRRSRSRPRLHRRPDGQVACARPSRSTPATSRAAWSPTPPDAPTSRSAAAARSSASTRAGDHLQRRAVCAAPRGLAYDAGHRPGARRLLRRRAGQPAGRAAATRSGP